jgi:flagellar biosynthesis chaperone FliJ
MTHDLDFNDAAKLGWEIEPRFEARKGDQVFRGTAAELTSLIAEHEERETTLEERRQHVLHRERHEPISRLVRRLGKIEEEHQREWDKYLDESQHHYTRTQALESATKMRRRQVEMFERLFEHPKEVLLANADFRELQAVLGEG